MCVGVGGGGGGLKIVGQSLTKYQFLGKVTGVGGGVIKALTRV